VTEADPTNDHPVSVRDAHLLAARRAKIKAAWRRVMGRRSAALPAA
jgi:hypothetical protein